MTPASPGLSVTEKMRAEWDSRARENARYYIATGQAEWSDDEFFESGRENVRREILTDMINICQGCDPKRMKVLEIGCGLGRITRALAETFGAVYAVDISGEMVAQARKALADLPNVHIFQNNVMDLAVGVIIGGAFGKIVDSFVGDIIMPLVGKVIGNIMDKVSE